MNQPDVYGTADVCGTADEQRDTIAIRVAGQPTRRVAFGTRIGTLWSDSATTDAVPVAAIVNGTLTSLQSRLTAHAEVSPITADDPMYAAVLRRTLCLVMAWAARIAVPDRTLSIGHAIADGYVYDAEDSGPLTASETDAVLTQVNRIREAALPIYDELHPYAAVLAALDRLGRRETREILEHTNRSTVRVNRVEDYVDLYHGPLCATTAAIPIVGIEIASGQMVVRYGRSRPPLSPVLFTIFEEYRHWGRVLGLRSVAHLNARARTKDVADFVWAAEALHDRKTADIADQIVGHTTPIKAVLIAGPSSSGKTTFTKKLSIQLRVLGLLPLLVSLDDFFLPRDRTPRDENGEYDFESLHAVDVELFNTILPSLFAGEPVAIPKFDFKTGTRSFSTAKITLPDNGLLLIEGIHGLNPLLSCDIADAIKFRVYVSALTQLNFDETNRLSTTDNRLIRRITRDHQFRGHSAANTIAMWPAVRRGEDLNIFPFQDEADAAFNSALDYELAVLRTPVCPLLEDVKPSQPGYNEAIRLLRLLEFITPISERVVPDRSILREFIGRSAFKY